jgi:hypothetical protein
MKKVFTLTLAILCLGSFGQRSFIYPKGKQLLGWIESINEKTERGQNSRTLQSRLLATSQSNSSCTVSDSSHFIYKTNSGAIPVFNLPQANENAYDPELWWAADSILSFSSDGSCIVSIDLSSSKKQTIINNKIVDGIYFDGKTKERVSYNSDNLATDYYADTILPNSTWGEYYHYHFSYNTNKKMTTIVGQHKQGASWQNEFQSRFIYNSNNNLVQIIDEDWDIGSSAWSKTNETNVFYLAPSIKSYIKDKSFTANDSSFTYFTYAGNLIQSDSNINSFNQIRINTYTYDASNYIIKKTKRAYVIGQPSPFLDTVFTTYNSYGQKLTEWDGIAKNNMIRWYWEEYNAPSAIEDNDSFSDITFHPNPMMEKATLSYTLKSSENVTISLHDITGRSIQSVFKNQFQSEGLHNMDVNFESQTQRGTYFLQLKGESFTKIIKVIKW